MEHLHEPPAGVTVVPVAQPVRVESARLTGSVIALAYTGQGGTYYLVVANNAQTRPVWVGERDVDIAYVGERP